MSRLLKCHSNFLGGHIHTHTHIYSRRQYKVSVPLKKKRCPTAYQHLKKRNRLPFLRSQFLCAIFHLTPPKSINRRAGVTDELERNWREEKRLIDEKSINNRRTEAERATRTAETIDGLERNWREEKLLIDEKSRNNRRTEAERASRRA